MQGREETAQTGDILMHNMPGQATYDQTKPTLTRDWVMANKDNLSEGKFNELLTAVTPSVDAAIHEDPKNLLMLDDLVQSDPARSQVVLRDQFSSHQISRGTYDQLSARAQGILNGLEKRPYVAQVRTDLSTYLQGAITSGGGGTPTANELSKIREALFVFDDWAAQNKEADRSQVEQFSNDLARNYQTYVALYRQNTLPLPIYLGGLPRTSVTVEALRGAQGRLAADIAAGRISESQGADEQRNIAQWQDLVPRISKLPQGYKTLP